MTMKIDMEKMRELEAQKLISIQKHPTADLLIFNYTPVCQYRKAWDEHTVACRGLITDLEGNVVARPFNKFFNVEEHEQEGSPLPPLNWKQHFTAMKKLDGSLGILYRCEGWNYIATRGSFTSEQAVRANKIMREKGYAEKDFNPRMTYLFEIIYPENRIVVDYGETDDLFLLDIIDTQTGEAMHREFVAEEARRIGCPLVEFFYSSSPDPRASMREYMSGSGSNEEGLVVRFADGTRVKMKFEEYKRLHRLITGVSSRRIWEALRDGKGIQEMIENVPDEFMEWVKKTADELVEKHNSALHHAREAVRVAREILGDAPRRDYAMKFRETPDVAGILFSIFDGRDPSPLIWKHIRPASTSPFKNDSES